MKNWQRVRLVELCEAHVDCVNRTAPVVEGPTPYKMIRTTNVRGGFVDVESVKYVSEETYVRWTRRLVPQHGDIILTREAPLGGVGKVRGHDRIFLGQRLYHFRAARGLADGDFLMYALMGPDLQSQIRAFGSGSTVEHMRLPDIEKLEVDVPRIDVQRRIASILSAYDELIENSERRIRVLDEMARALYREWFVLFRYPGHDKVPLVDSPIGRIPKGWRPGEAGVVARENRRSVPKGALEGGICRYVGLEHIPRRSLALDAWVETSELGSNKLQFERGEVLFGKIRPYFHKVAVAPFSGVCSADTFVISATEPSLRSFTTCLVSSDEFVAHASATANGAKMPRASWDVMMQFQVALPSRALSAAFAAIVEPWLEEQGVLVSESQNLRSTRDLLLPRLLSGQLSVEATE